MNGLKMLSHLHVQEPYSHLLSKTDKYAAWVQTSPSMNGRLQIITRVEFHTRRPSRPIAFFTNIT